MSKSKTHKKETRSILADNFPGPLSFPHLPIVPRRTGNASILYPEMSANENDKEEPQATTSEPPQITTTAPSSDADPSAPDGTEKGKSREDVAAERDEGPQGSLLIYSRLYCF